ncbi:hypothetical protein F4009_03955 [Candidatus Poribacteria bacterium]|nr:hypothetical protein [Candidatus Poribacteria bacterium]MYH79515.1 hypothetical protein [Candidatus Poribacteria bacterium]MYK93152.1 hypothetical protein [Candidatus Poribacteria bacterium]
MKIIHIYAMILFVGLLSLPLDGFANCDSAEAALTAAQDRLTTAREEFAQIVKDMMILLGGVSMSDVSNSDKPGGTTRSGIRKYLADKLKRMAEEAEDKVERAEMAVTSAQYSLEMCRMPDLAACGHPMPGHNRYQYSCGHHDYSCDKEEHRLRSGGRRMCGW